MGDDDAVRRERAFGFFLSRVINEIRTGRLSQAYALVRKGGVRVGVRVSSENEREGR